MNDRKSWFGLNAAVSRPRSRRHARPSRAARSVVEVLEGRQMLAVDAPTFVAIADVTNSFGDTRRAIAYYDVSTLATNPGQQQGVFGQEPTFSAWVGFELTNQPQVPGGVENQEEISAVAVNPINGDTYQLAFDSNTGGSVGTADPVGDTFGDYDLYRINVATVYNDYALRLRAFEADRDANPLTNPNPRGVMYTNTVAPDGFNYLSAYGGRPLGPTGQRSVAAADLGIPAGRDNTDADPSNDILFLAGATEKVAEIARVQGESSTEPPFFDEQDLQFVDAETLLLMESNDGVNLDHQVRLIERVATTPGAAPAAGVNPITGDPQDLVGGYRPTASGTTGQPNYPPAGTPLAAESWQAVPLNNAFPDLDPADLDDIDGMRYVERDGVRGVWVSERDIDTGDELGFFQIDFATNTLTPGELLVGAGPAFPNNFNLDNDPAANDNRGQIGFFDVDETGDLFIEERNAFDVDESGAEAPAEPQVITRDVPDYSAGDANGNGVQETQVGAFGDSGPFAGVIHDGADAGPIDLFPSTRAFGVFERGQDYLYVFDADPSGTADVVSDVYVVDADPASPTFGRVVYQELNAANHFLADANRIRAFTLGDAFAQDGVVEARDIDALYDRVADPTAGGRFTAPVGRETFDLTGPDDLLNQADVDALVRRVIGTEFGDANLDGRVDVTDLGILSTNFNKPGGWAMGDFSGDDRVDVTDLGRLATNFNFVAPMPAGSLKAAASRLSRPATIKRVR